MAAAIVDATAEECAYCGLPLPLARPSKSRLNSASGSAGMLPRFCCFGCRFAAAIAQEKAETGHLHGTMARLGFAAFFSMNVMVFTMVLWTHDVYDVEIAKQSSMSLLDELFRYACLIFSLPALFLLGGPLLENAWASLRQRAFTTDWLLLIGTGAAFGYSIVSVLRGSGHLYFEVGCVTLLAVTLGRWLEATGKSKTAEAIGSLEKLLPESARVVTGGQERLVPLREIVAGQRIRVLPGERIPLDGIICEGRALVDEQLWTGECAPVSRESGDSVRGGTLNLDGDLRIDVVSGQAAGSLARLMEAVRAAALAKGKIQLFADRIAAWFTPLVSIVALGAVLVRGWRGDWGNGLLAGLAVVLIACPCALGLATPMAIWSALGRAARSQVLFRSGDAVTTLAGVKVLCFDKTGTLTSGRCEVEQLYVADGASWEELLRRARDFASASTHVLSQAIQRFCATSERTARSSPEPVIHDDVHPMTITTIPGKGLKGSSGGRDCVVYLGSARLMREAELKFSDEQSRQLNEIELRGAPLTCIGWSGRVRGIFAFQERMRPEAARALQELQTAGWRVVVLTGDYLARAAALQRELHVDVRANLLPEEKAAVVADLREKFGPVAMIGDGINDVPALASADVGIAMGCGADVSRDSADVCLLGNDLSRIFWSIQVARQTVRTIRWNLFWAFAYNVLGMGLAATGWLNPILAAVAMTLSSFLVVTNSLRLGWDSDPVSTLNVTNPGSSQ